MRNTIVLEVDDVYLNDFDNKVSAPELIDERTGGVTILFNDIEELKAYRDQISAAEDESLAESDRNKAKVKLIPVLNKAMRENQVVVDAIKSFAQAVFGFIFNAEAHRQDKLAIFETVLADIREATNSWELETAIQEGTFEIGIPEFNHKITFYNYAHNQIDYDFQKIKNRLIKDLLMLKVSLTEG
jgi:hypothetical protein